MAEMNDIPVHESLPVIGVGGVFGTAMSHVHSAVGLFILFATAYVAYKRAKREMNRDKAGNRCRYCRFNPESKNPSNEK